MNLMLMIHEKAIIQNIMDGTDTYYGLWFFHKITTRKNMSDFLASKLM